MSALGQKQTLALQKGMSALPPKATSNAKPAARPLQMLATVGSKSKSDGRSGGPAASH
jgi:hypothetical protein